MKTEAFYKFLTPEGTGGYSSYVWPKDGWTPLIEYSTPLKMCVRGYHVLTQDQLLGSYMRAELWRVDVAGEIVRGGNKLIVRQARRAERIGTWNDRTARLFACDCAERVLPIFQVQYPNDQRPFQAIECARRFANGKTTLQELKAAWAAAWSAAWSAADAAADAAEAARAVARASAEAARTADATADIERKWQQERLMHYLQLAA